MGKGVNRLSGLKLGIVHQHVYHNNNGVLLNPGNGGSELLASYRSQNESQESIVEVRPRFDKFGNKIVHGGKKHKITFVDEFYPNRNIARIVLVESYKKYNHATYDESNESICHCSLF